MTGRPKNWNRPPTTSAVRVSSETMQRIYRLHIGSEPYGNTVDRALAELEALRKKVKALEQGHETHVSYHTNANDELIKILKKRDDEIEHLKSQRKFMGGIQAER